MSDDPFRGLVVPANEGARAPRADDPFRGLLGASVPTSSPGLDLGLDANPDEVAKQKQAAERLGIPVEAVQVDPSQAMREARRREVYHQLADAPVTSRFMEDPTNAGLSNDAVNELSSFERLSRAFERGQRVHDVGAAGAAYMRNPSEAQRDYMNKLNQRVKQLGGDGDGFIGFLSSAAEVVGQQYQSFSQTKAGQRVIGGAIIGGTIGAVGGGPLAPATGIAGTLMGAGAGFISHLVVDTFEQEGGNAYVDMLDMGINPNVAKPIALGVGLINSALETASASVILKPFAEAGKMALRVGVKEMLENAATKSILTRLALSYGEGIGAEVLTENLQEISSIVGEEVAKAFSPESGAKPATAEDIQNRLWDITTKTFKAMVVLAAPGPGIRFISEKRAAKRAEEDATTLDELAKQAQSSPLTQRDAGASADFHARVLENVGMPDVSVTAEAVSQVVATSENPTEMLAKLGLDAETLANEQARGGDVSIPAETFTKEVLQNPAVYEQVKGHIRVDPNGMTLEEAKAFKEGGIEAEANAAMQETAAERASRDILNVTQDAKKPKKAAAPQVFDPLKQPPQRDILQVNADLAERELGLQGLFTSAEEAGMTPTQYQAYLANLQRASEASRTAAAARVMKEEQRKASAEWQAQREALRGEVSAEIEAQPVYAAQNGLIGIKDRLDYQAVADAVGENAMETIPRTEKGQRLYARKGEKGVDPDAYAQLFGFADAREMITAMKSALPLKQAVEDALDARMEQAHPQLSKEMRAIQAAIESLHSKDYAGILVTELNQLRDAKKQGRVSRAQIKAAALAMLQQHRASKINPQVFIRASRQAAKEATKLLRKGDRDGAAQAKFRQIINFEMAMQAIKIRETLAKRFRFLRKLATRNFPDVPEAYMDAIRQILGDYGIGAQVATEDRIDLAKWAAAQTEAGSAMVEIPADLLNPFNFQDQSKLTLEQFTALHDAVKTLYTQGKNELRLLRESEKATVREIAQNVADTIRANLKARNLGPEGTDRRIARIKKAGLDYVSLIFNADTFLRTIDGFKDLGVAYKAIKGGFDRAISYGYHEGQVGYTRRQIKEAKSLIDLFSVFTKKEMRGMTTPRAIPGVAQKYSHQERLAILLNMGNKDNFEALTDSGQFTPGELQAILDHSTKKDLDFVQSVWDYLDSFWPEIAAAERRRKGTAPERVDARAFSTRHGDYKGGYFPLRYDDAKSPETIETLIDDIRFGRLVYRQTRRGHTIERQGSGGRPVKLSMATLHSHVNQVIYDLEVGDALSDSFKILHNHRVKSALSEVGHMDKWHGLNLWLSDQIAGEIRQTGVVEMALRHLRAGFTVSKLAWNMSTALLQPLGVFNTAVQIGKLNTLKGLQLMLANHVRASEYASETSPFMAERAHTFHKDINDARRMIETGFLKAWAPGRSAEWAANSYFYLIVKAQRFADLVTWYGAMHKSMKEQGDEAVAIEYADRMVARAQASGLFGERSALERGTINTKIRQTETARVWTALASYFIAKTNIAYERTKKTNFKNPVEAVNWAVDMTLLYMAEALIVGLIRGQLPDGEDEEKTWTKYLGKQFINAIVAGVPIVRELVSAVSGFAPGGVFAASMDQFGRAGRQISQGEIDRALVTNVNNALGILFHYPSSQMNKTGQAIARAREGEEMSFWEFVFGPSPNK